MLQYLIKRIVSVVITLVFVSVISYVIMNMAPGDAVSMYVNPKVLSRGSNAEYFDKVREQLGLEKPLLLRYFSWLRETAKGNLGYSYISQQPVLGEIQARLGPTLLLCGSSLLFSLLLGVSAGIYCAKRQYQLPDYLLSTLSLVGMSLPSFWFAMLLILLFTLKLNWLPSVGLETVGLKGSWLLLLADRVKHLVMPVCALSLQNIGIWMRHMRSSYLEIMNQDYIRTARSKGLREDSITWIHAFRNASLPVVTLLGESMPELIGGAFVTESVFGLPGLGRYGIQAIINRDYPVVMATTFFSSILVLFGMLMADMIYVAVDPRIRLSA